MCIITIKGLLDLVRVQILSIHSHSYPPIKLDPKWIDRKEMFMPVVVQQPYIHSLTIILYKEVSQLILALILHVILSKGSA